MLQLQVMRKGSHHQLNDYLAPVEVQRIVALIAF